MPTGLLNFILEALQAHYTKSLLYIRSIQGAKTTYIPNTPTAVCMVKIEEVDLSLLSPGRIQFPMSLQCSGSNNDAKSSIIQLYLFLATLAKWCCGTVRPSVQSGQWIQHIELNGEFHFHEILFMHLQLFT